MDSSPPPIQVINDRAGWSASVTHVTLALLIGVTRARERG
jgi:hypothetical protein